MRAKFLDDANGAPWDPAAVGANARSATQDSSAVAYIGELDSEPTRASLPITNDAGLVQVSPGAGGVDLTRPAAGYPDSPDRYQPSGEASFARVVPSDDLLVRAAADWASELKAMALSAVSDGTPFGDLMVSEFTTAAEEAGLQVHPEAAAVELAFSASDGDGIELRGPGTVRTVAAEVDPSRLPSGQADSAFAADFQAQFGRPPGPYAAYGYEAMALVLQAIGDAGTDTDQFRDSVRDGVLGAERPESSLGPYSITDEGDSTVCLVQRYELAGGRREPREASCPAR